MNPEANISVFENCITQVPAGLTTIQDFCDSVRSGQYANQVLTYRKISDPTIQKRVKVESMPAVSITGVFTYRNDNNLSDYSLIHPSGFLAIDIDASQNQSVSDWPALRDKISAKEYILFSALSISGNGLFCIIPIARPDLHELYFQELRHEFLTTWGLQVDNIPEPSQLRVYSFDMDAKLNPSANYYLKN